MKSAAGKDSQQQAGEVGFFSHFDSQMHFSVSRLPSKPPASQSSIVHISNVYRYFYSDTQTGL